MKAHIRSHASEAATIAVVMLVFLVVIFGSIGLKIDPALFPRIIGTAGIVVTLAVAYRFLRGHTELDSEDQLAQATQRKRLVALFSPPLYGVLFYVFGFYVAAGLAIGIVPWLLGYRRPVVLILLGIGTIVCLSLMFSYLLDVPIPLGIVGEWFMHRFIYVD